MRILFAFLLFFNPAQSTVEMSASSCSETKRTGALEFVCEGLKSLENLDKASNNVTSIIIYDSKISNIPSRTFLRFGATLLTLDLHNSGIRTIDSQGFAGLYELDRLILWGNQLTWVQAAWFSNFFSLRVLDLSFNSIQSIEYPAFQMTSNLEYLYFDYNQLKSIDWTMFIYLTKLKKIKLGKNPWKWWFRALLTQQLDNQKVDYKDEWEDWTWMSNVVWKCVESGQGTIPNDDVLDCAVKELLDFTFDSFKTLNSSTAYSDFNSCSTQVSRLVECSKIKSGGSIRQAIRKILQGFASDFKQMERFRERFRF